jgi:hypothetical protein
MIEAISILGVDASLRATGLSVVTYDPLSDSRKPFVSYCNIVTVPQVHKGHDAVLFMIDQLVGLEKPIIAQVVIESPAAIFNPKFPSSSLLPMAHIAGACVPIFGSDVSFLIHPSEWNKTRKKDVTHAKLVEQLGDPNSWPTPQKEIKQKYHEHILDAAGMALYWLETRYSAHLMASHD